jgi:RNA polymerase sigma-70 factor (ECF subfamily)
MSTPARRDAGAAPAAPDVEELYRRHSRLVAGICRALLRDREEAADASQQTFLAAHRALRAGTRPDDPAAWLSAIARNECRQRVRRRMAAPVTTPLDDELDGRGDTTYHAAVRGIGVGELRAAVSDLPERQRDALLQREVRGLSYDEIAATMGTTAPAVETLLVRARRTVAARLRVVPELAFGWARELVGRLSGPADAATAAALAAKGAAAVIAAVTATGAAVEVQRSLPPEPAGAAVTRVDNSGPGSASSGQGRGRGRGGERLEAASDGSGQGRGRGRGRGRSGEGESRDRDDRSGSSSGSG